MKRKILRIIALAGMCAIVFLIAHFFENEGYYRITSRLAAWGAIVGGGKLAGLALAFGGTAICIGIVNILERVIKKSITYMKRRKA